MNKAIERYNVVLIFRLIGVATCLLFSLGGVLCFAGLLLLSISGLDDNVTVLIALGGVILCSVFILISLVAFVLSLILFISNIKSLINGIKYANNKDSLSLLSVHNRKRLIATIIETILFSIIAFGLFLLKLYIVFAFIFVYYLVALILSFKSINDINIFLENTEKD